MCFSPMGWKQPTSAFHKKKTESICTARFPSLFFSQQCCLPFCFIFFGPIFQILPVSTNIHNMYYGCAGSFSLIRWLPCRLPDCGKKAGRENMHLCVSQVF